VDVLTPPLPGTRTARCKRLYARLNPTLPPLPPPVKRGGLDGEGVLA
jgi:hypothetical protein